MKQTRRHRYAPPTLVRHQRLAAVAAGPLPVVTGRTTVAVKGGCFEAKKSRP